MHISYLLSYFHILFLSPFFYHQYFLKYWSMLILSTLLFCFSFIQVYSNTSGYDFSKFTKWFEHAVNQIDRKMFKLASLVIKQCIKIIWTFCFINFIYFKQYHFFSVEWHYFGDHGKEKIVSQLKIQSISNSIMSISFLV